MVVMYHAIYLILTSVLDDKVQYLASGAEVQKRQITCHSLETLHILVVKLEHIILPASVSLAFKTWLGMYCTQIVKELNERVNIFRYGEAGLKNLVGQ